MKNYDWPRGLEALQDWSISKNSQYETDNDVYEFQASKQKI